jgi:hypothetical protein
LVALVIVIAAMHASSATVLEAAATTGGDLVLSAKMMELTRTAADLSSLAYLGAPLGGTGWSRFDCYHSEPNQAVVAERDGYCYAAYRGRTLSWDEWKEELAAAAKHEVCRTSTSSFPFDKTTKEKVKKGEDSQVCCMTSQTFWEAYANDYRDAVEDDLRNCAQGCKNPDECVVITGHSLGGAVGKSC